jgi:hypothetical protein
MGADAAGVLTPSAAVIAARALHRATFRIFMGTSQKPTGQSPTSTRIGHVE